MTTELTVPTKQSAEQCLRALGLHRGWVSTDGLPPEATPTRIQSALTATAGELAAAAPEQFAVAIMKLVKFGKAFGILDASHAGDMTAFYREGMSDIPPDLLELAVSGTIRTWKWPRMPSPADLRNAIASQLDDRRAARHAMERALFKAQMEARNKPKPGKPLTPEQRAQVKRMLEARKQRLNPEPEMTREEAERDLKERKAKLLADHWPG